MSLYTDADLVARVNGRTEYRSTYFVIVGGRQGQSTFFTIAANNQREAKQAAREYALRFVSDFRWTPDSNPTINYITGGEK